MKQRFEEIIGDLEDDIASLLEERITKVEFIECVECRLTKLKEAKP